MNWRYLFFAPAVIFIIYLIGKFSSGAPLLVITLSAAIAVLLVTFQKPENGLFVIIFSMLLSPEIILSRVSSRAVTVRIDDVMIIAVFVAWVAHQTFTKEKKIFAKTALDTPIFFYFVIVLISTSLGVMRGNVSVIRGFFYVLKYLEYFIIFFLVSNIVSDKKQIQLFLYAGLATAIIVTLNSYVQIAQGVPRTSAPFDVPYGTTGFGEPATLGGYYLVIFSIIAGLISFSSSSNTRFLFLGLLLFMVPPFIRTLSRASYFAMILLYLTTLFFSKQNRTWWLILSLFMIIASPYIFPKLGNEMEKRITQTYSGANAHEEVSIGGKRVKIDLSAMARVWAWKYILEEKLPKHFMLGWGVTGTSFVDAQIPLILGETGMLGLLTFLWIIITMLVQSRKVMVESSDPFFKGLGLGLLAAVIALLTQSITTNTFIIVRIMEPFWFLAAIVLRIGDIEKNGQEGGKLVTA